MDDIEWRTRTRGRRFGGAVAVFWSGFALWGLAGAIFGGKAVGLADRPNSFVLAVVSAAVATFALLVTFRPLLRAAADGITVRNLGPAHFIAWGEFQGCGVLRKQLVLLRTDGTHVGWVGASKSNIARWLHRETRADAIMAELHRRRDAAKHDHS